MHLKTIRLQSTVIQIKENLLRGKTTNVYEKKKSNPEIAMIEM